MSKALIGTTKILLLLTLLTPLIVVGSLPYPFVFGKMLFYRVVVEIALVLALLLLVIRAKRNAGFLITKTKALLHSPLFLLLIGFFIVSAFISTLTAPVFFKAFFGEIERGEGFLAFFHYIVFLIIAISIFEKRDWFLFMKVAIGIGVIVALLAWLQFFGLSGLPLGLKTLLEQPGSSLGNPAYLSAFLILLLVLSALLLREAREEKHLKIFLGAAAAFFIATIFITAVRGAILGVAVGALSTGALYAFSSRAPKRFRQAGTALVVFMVLFGGLFWATKGSGVWDNVPGLNRFARVSLEIPSVSTRLLGLELSFNAWKEKPILGWGIEHYNVAYNQHYNPAYEYYAEEWFDRAHNKIAEVAVIQGAFGLFLYLGILVVTLWFSRTKPLVFGAFLAYVIQNIFLFDIPTSYLIVFSFWGYLIAERLGDKEEGQAVVELKMPPWIPKIVLPAALAVVILAVSYHLYAYVYIPIRQALTYNRAVQTGQGEKVLLASDEIFYPFNYLQSTLRAQLVDKLFDLQLVRKKDFRPLVDKALAALEETAEREKYEPRQYIRLAENYNELAKDKAEFFEKALPFVERAVELAPKRQGVRHIKAFTLSGLGRFDESVETVRQSVALEPRSYKAYYNLGLNAALASHAPQYKNTPAGEAYEKEALEALDQALLLAKENEYLFFSRSDFENLKIIYTRLGAYRQAARVLEIMIFTVKSNDQELFPKKEKQLFIDTMTLYRTLRDADGMIRIAEKMKTQFADDEGIVRDLDVIIDLVKKGEWEILDTL